MAEQEWHRVRRENESVRAVHQRRLQLSASRREREEAKRQQLAAEIALIDISLRVMKPKQLKQCREEIQRRIGIAVPAGAVEL